MTFERTDIGGPDRGGYADPDQDPNTWQPGAGLHELCRYCDHFIEDNASSAAEIKAYGLAEYVHLDDGEKEHDHDAMPSGIAMPLGWWQLLRPDLFEADAAGTIGPNRPDHVKLERPA